MGLKSQSSITIFIGGILTLLLYGAPVLEKSMKREGYKSNIIRGQRVISIKMAKAYRTVSSIALCILTGMTHIAIKIEGATQLYILTKGNKNKEAKVDTHMGVKHWQHPADDNKCT